MKQHVEQQIGLHNITYRLVRAVLAALGVIVAMGHLPGYDPALGAFVHPAEVAFEYIGVAVALLAGLITSESKK